VLTAVLEGKSSDFPSFYFSTYRQTGKEWGKAGMADAPLIQGKAATFEECGATRNVNRRCRKVFFSPFRVVFPDGGVLANWVWCRYKSVKIQHMSNFDTFEE